MDAFIDDNRILLFIWQAIEPREEEYLQRAIHEDKNNFRSIRLSIVQNIKWTELEVSYDWLIYVQL